MTLELSELRQQISAIDDEILKLAGKRLELARHVGEYKRSHGLAVSDFQVEKVIIELSRARAKAYGVPRPMALALTKILIKYSVEIQKHLEAKT